MNYFDLNLRQLQTFVTVARLNSFTAAARLLHLSQPALTKQVRQLEETLGVRLFDRNTRTVELTRIGKELAPVVNQLLREIEAVVVNTKELAEKSRGVVRVAALPSISSTFLPTVIARFKEQYPGVSVVLKDVIAQRLVALVKAEEVDFGVGSLAVADPEVRFSQLLSDHLIVVFPPGSALEKKKAIGLPELVSLPLILTEGGSSVRKLVDQAVHSVGKLTKPVFEVTYMSTAAGMVRAGLGIAILPASAFEMGELTGLCSRPIKSSALTRKIGIIEKNKRSLSPAAESFLKVMKEICKETKR